MNEPVHVVAMLFASLKEAAGQRTVASVLSRGSTVADLGAHLAERHPALRERLPLARVAVNDRLVEAGTVLQCGDEVSFLPAVSGG